jgi:glycosyltransferase involved in cell wall biosynthesis
MARAMVARGHTVTVLCGHVGQQTDTKSSGLRVLRAIDCAGGNYSVRQQVADIGREVIERTAVDIVECAEYSADGLELQRLGLPTPVCIRLHGSACMIAKQLDPGWKRIARRFMFASKLAKTIAAERETIARAAAVTGCSCWVLNETRQFGWPFPNLNEVIYNPIPAPPESLPSQLDAIPESVLWLGRLDRLKGAGLLAGVAAQVLKQMPNLTIGVLGPDMGRSKRESWRSFIESSLTADQKKRIRFYGGVPHQDVASLIVKHQVAIFASVFECFPYSHLECMQLGLPCVIASGGGAKELGQDGESLLRSERNAKSLSAGICRLLEDSTLRRSIGSRAQSEVLERFSSATIALQMESFFERCIALSRGNAG